MGFGVLGFGTYEVCHVSEPADMQSLGSKKGFRFRVWGLGFGVRVWGLGFVAGMIICSNCRTIRCRR